MESGLQELKFSRYNQKVELSGKLFLYNALTGGYASVDEEYRDNFDKCDFKKLDSMKELAELPNAIINQLMEGGFIIPKNFDEFNVIKSMHYRGRFGANKALTMTLIPTMNCNFRCPYCYEKDKKYPVKKMTTEVMDAIIKYVESRIDSVDHIFVTWYGGEPLLGLHEIRIMQNKLIELASQKDVQVSGMIITNGYAVSPNSILVEPDGTLQKCWNVVGDKNEAIGNIMDIDDEFNGTLQERIIILCCCKQVLKLLLF